MFEHAVTAHTVYPKRWKTLAGAITLLCAVWGVALCLQA